MWAAPQAQLRHRRVEPRGKSSDVLQPSIQSLSKQEKGMPRGGRGLVNSLLWCAQAMAFTFVMYVPRDPGVVVSLLPQSTTTAHHADNHSWRVTTCYTTPSPPHRPPLIRP
ncbi:hypothetical protein E2C01_069878 [Portunus trituberculatus]|uniref:Uncharacterized protein n=1 Tax=Portunus trituberculatus TaxID=210409 RepID=A0A5B7I3I3_PORTR|nr:hypothetical protein [Portunus trituberculatus]